MQLDSAEIFFQPFLAGCVERVARAVVDDQEDLPAAASPNELFQELEKCAAIELVSKPIAERRILERNRSEDVSRLSLPECVYSRLFSDS